MDYPTISYIRDNGIRPVKKRGQNFLVDKNIAEKAVSHGHILPSDTVLEIGPGPGSLTYFLTQTQARIFSFEIDTHLFNLFTVKIDNDVSLLNPCLIGRTVVLNVSYQRTFSVF